MTKNSAQGGFPGGGSAGLGSFGIGKGGGLCVGKAYLDAFTVAHVTHNTASTSDPDIYGTWTAL